MALFTKNFIISLILTIFIFCNFPLQAAQDGDEPVIPKKVVHVHKKTKNKKTQKKKTRRPSHKKKQKKSSSIKKKKKTESPREITPVVEEKDRSIERTVQEPVSKEGGSLQNVVENEIIHLKATRRLLPGDEISLQVYDLNAKKMLADVNGTVIRNAASLIKVYVLLAVYEAISRQELQESPEIEHHLYRMIAISDNGATNHLIRRLGQGDALKGIMAVNAQARKWGFSGTRLRELIPEGGKTYSNQTSVADTTLFYRLLYEQKLISPQYSQKMNDILQKNIHDRIKTFQIKQDGVAVADKTGYVRGLNGDCGIVYQKGMNSGCDYALSIIIENKSRPSDGAWGKKKSAVIRYLSDRIYQFLKNG
ncbi:MAG: serine hydrolase [Thermodesulfobacteriota bacterium]